MTPYKVEATAAADFDIEAAFRWYESHREGLGIDFLKELQGTYDKISEGPFKYQELRPGIRRVLVNRFPYGVFFIVRDEVVVITAVLHVSRDPAEWQKRRGH